MTTAHALTAQDRANLMSSGRILAAPVPTRLEASRTAWTGKYRKRLHERQRQALAKLHARTPLAQPTNLPATKHETEK